MVRKGAHGHASSHTDGEDDADGPCIQDGMRRRDIAQAWHSGSMGIYVKRSFLKARKEEKRGGSGRGEGGGR